MSLHWPPESLPAGMLVHVPFDADSAHDLHGPLQAPEQQTPCAQTLLSQSLFSEQLLPTGFFEQMPPLLQMSGATQSESLVQLVLHMALAVSHTKPPWQVDVIAGVQVPVPLQVRGGVSVVPTQVPVAQVVDAA
jgi:hypothetical protein